MVTVSVELYIWFLVQVYMCLCVSTCVHACVPVHVCISMCGELYVIFPLVCSLYTHIARSMTFTSQGHLPCLFQWHMSSGYHVAWVLAPGASHPPWKVLGIKMGEGSFPDSCNSYFTRWMTLWMWLWSASAYAVLYFLLFSESKNLRKVCIWSFSNDFFY